MIDKEKKAEYMKKYREANEEKISEQGKKYREANKQKISERGKKYYQSNKEKKANRSKKYREANEEKIYEQKKKWYQANKEREAEKRKKRRNTDSLYKMKSYLRTRTSAAFKNKGYKKNSKTENMLGISYEKVKKHIGRQFQKGMTWSNYGEWHIDHIMPLSSAKTEAELLKLCHYRNLQPLWAADNISKGAKIPQVQIQIKL